MATVKPGSITEHHTNCRLAFLTGCCMILFVLVLTFFQLEKSSVRIYPRFCNVIPCHVEEDVKVIFVRCDHLVPFSILWHSLIVSTLPYFSSACSKLLHAFVSLPYLSTNFSAHSSACLKQTSAQP